MGSRAVASVMRRVVACLLALAAGPVSVAAQPNPESIRVAVVRDGPEVLVEVHGRWTMSDAQSGQPLQEGRRLRQTAVRAGDGGLRFGDEVLPVAGVRLEPGREASIDVNGSRLRGRLEIVRQDDGRLLVINHVALEDYLRGVLSKEAPDYWPEEALKAIAVAARTYAVYQRFTKEQQAYDVSGDVMSQDYGGHAAEKDATDRAVAATAGWIVLEGSRLFPTFYHSTCGGRTEHGLAMGTFEVRPLRGNIECTFCQASPFFSWQRRLTRADVNWALRQSRFGPVGPVRGMRVVKRTPSGRAEQIAIIGDRTLTLSGYEFRSVFGFETIRSPLLTIVPLADAFVVQGHGWGHGVGLCQWGAAELARRGWTAAQILAYYYPGATLADIARLTTEPIDVARGGP